MHSSLMQVRVILVDTFHALDARRAGTTKDIKPCTTHKLKLLHEPYLSKAFMPNVKMKAILS